MRSQQPPPVFSWPMLSSLGVHVNLSPTNEVSEMSYIFFCDTIIGHLGCITDIAVLWIRSLSWSARIPILYLPLTWLIQMQLLSMKIWPDQPNVLNHIVSLHMEFFCWDNSSFRLHLSHSLLIPFHVFIKSITDFKKDIVLSAHVPYRQYKAPSSSNWPLNYLLQMINLALKIYALNHEESIRFDEIKRNSATYLSFEVVINSHLELQPMNCILSPI